MQDYSAEDVEDLRAQLAEAEASVYDQDQPRFSQPRRTPRPRSNRMDVVYPSREIPKHWVPLAMLFILGLMIIGAGIAALWVEVTTFVVNPFLGLVAFGLSVSVGGITLVILARDNSEAIAELAVVQRYHTDAVRYQGDALVKALRDIHDRLPVGLLAAPTGAKKTSPVPDELPGRSGGKS